MCGAPEDFYRILEREEYDSVVNGSKVVLGIDTAEHLLAWDKIEHHIANTVRSHENISIHEYSELVHAKRLEGDTQHRYKLTFVSGKETSSEFSNYVVNSTWYEIEKLNSLVGFPQRPIPRTNRLKVLLHVRLPYSMLDFHSMFFCMGQFCMFSNLGNGTALVTYAPVTNVAMSTAVSISSNMSRLLTDGPTDDEFRLLSDSIRRGATSFVPEIKNTETIGLNFGIVQTHGTVDLDDIRSPVHKRAYLGVRSESAGWVSNPCMKLLYLLENGDIVKDILEEEFTKDSGL